MDRKTSPWRTLLLSLLLGAGTLAAFWPVVHHNFIKLDDGLYVALNARVLNGLTWGGIEWAFRTGYQGNWHPLTWLSHMLDVQFFGLNPGRHHLTSLLLHTANSLLLFLLLRRLTGAEWRSLMVAALFALHPLHVESVAWVAERKDVLSTFFFFLTLLAYARYVEKSAVSNRSAIHSPQSTEGTPSIPHQVSRFTFHVSRLTDCPSFFYALSLLFFALGLMSKPMLVTLPFVLLLLDFWPLERFRFENQKSKIKNLLPLLLEKMPFLGLTTLVSALTFIVQTKNHATALLLPLVLRFYNAVASYCKYLARTFWPAKLAIFYPHPDTCYPLSEQWPPWQILLAAAMLGAVTVLALLRLKRQPWLVVGWLWFLGTLLPVIGLVQVGRQAMADRYTYIPLVGIFISAVWGVTSLLNPKAEIRRPKEAQNPNSEVRTLLSPSEFGFQISAFFRPSDFGLRVLPQIVLASLGALALGACFVLTRHQLGYWKNDFTVFSHALAVTAHNAPAHYRVGMAFRDQSDFAKALQHFQAAVADDPAYGPAFVEMGAIAEESGHRQEALAHYQAAVRATPWDGLLHNHLANLLWEMGRQQEALEQYTLALRCDPDDVQAHFNLGLALTQSGDVQNAAAHFAAVVQLQPGDAEARENLGRLLARQGKLDDALTQFRQAARLKPDWPDALNDLAWLLATHPRTDARNGSEAVRLAERACQLSGAKEARFWSSLDAAYAEVGRFPDARRVAEKARDLALTAGQTNMAQAAGARLELYRKEQPFHQAF
ncbi:MAG TPA: tetratricopeptide repeat protein [Candidatus Binatia bacterium]|jgi:tetratricopeptide (TPR) repeat protein|nr:tetratricopeptide repeat protein [Candidatus Binatia bacterium]